MALRNANNIFLTPDRKPLPDTANKTFSTAYNPIFLKAPPQPTSCAMSPQLNPKISRPADHHPAKRSPLQTKVDQLKAYLDRNVQIDKTRIRQIFDWREENGSPRGQEKKLLKELGHKVRALIKENTRLKHAVHSGAIDDLHSENERLQALIQNAYPTQTHTHTPSLSHNIRLLQSCTYSLPLEEHSFGRKSISNTRDQPALNQQYHQSDCDSHQIDAVQTPESVQHPQWPKFPQQSNQPLFNHNLLSQSRLQNLKQYFTLYINTALQQNQQTMAAQQKYIRTLEKRLACLEKMDEKIEHLRFEKRVGMQKATRKSKNYTIQIPTILGDGFEDQLMEPCNAEEEKHKKKELELTTPITYYSHKQRQSQPNPHQQPSQQTIDRLRQQTLQLKQIHRELKDKYEIQIEQHLRDLSERQRLLLEVEKLSVENNLLRSLPLQ